MLFMSLLCGFLWDAQHLLADSPSDPYIYTDPVPTLRFGYSIILYAFMGFIVLSIQPFTKSGNWYMTIALAGLSLFLYLLVEYSLLTFVRGGFLYDQRVFLRIVYSALLTMPFSFLIFVGLFKVAKLCGYQIRYQGLKKERKLDFDLRYE